MYVKLGETKIGYPEALCFGLAGGDGFENILVIEGGS